MSEISTNLPQRGLLVRHTGELVDLDDPAQCAFALVSIRDLEGELRVLKLRLSEAIAAEAARQGTKTLELNKEWKAVLSGGTDIQWDAERLMADLKDAGMPLERIVQIVEPKLEYKVNAVEAKRAAGANPDYAFAVESCRTEVEAPIRVSVRRA